MTSYRYEGLSANGAEVSGVVEAFDEQDAVAHARESCSVLLSVKPVAEGKKGILSQDVGTLLSGNKIKPKKLALLCSQLAIELKAGLTVVASLQLIAENESDKKLRQMLLDVADDVHAGSTLADSFATRGPDLPRTFIETVRAGEESGRLDECFAHLQVYYENNAAVSSKVGSAMIYPALLLVVAVVVIGIIMIKAVPVFESSFASLGNDLPLPTRILIGLSHFMTKNILAILAFILLVIFAVSVVKKTKSGARFFARLALTFPGIGSINRMNAASQLCSTMCAMMASGLTLLQAARITADVVSNQLIGEDISDAADGVTEGKRFCDGLRKSEWLPHLLVEMAGVGEETGHLEDTLGVVNDYYTKEVHAVVERTLSILEPVIIILMALIVVFILLSVYMPLFSMYGLI